MNKNNKLYIRTNDYSVTHKDFNIYINLNNKLLKTDIQNINLNDYYSRNYRPYKSKYNSILDLLYIYSRKINLYFRLKKISKYIKKNDYILDIGCGIGTFLQYIRKKGYNCIGLENNEYICNKKNIISNLNNIDIKFNAITFWHSLEHINNIDYILKKIKSIMKDEAIVVVCCPNYKSYDAKYYKKYWAGFDVPRHIWHFSKESINILFNKYGFKLLKTSSSFLDAIYISIISEIYKQNKIYLLNGIMIGLFSNLLGLITKEYSSIIYIFKKI